jgi:uncharacterized protein YjbI with pentapeptide repeats
VGSDARVDWETCTFDDPCIGVTVAGHRCLAHLDESDFAPVLARIESERVIDARGVRLAQPLLDRLLAVVRDRNDQVVLREAQFAWATFEGVADFSGGATFEDEAAFDGATFEGDTSFAGATFEGDTSFVGAIFRDDADFDGTAFKRDARFWMAAFEGRADFYHATFRADADFDEATFRVVAGFGEATFRGLAGFRGVTFKGVADFERATFGRAAAFGEATFRDDAVFDRVSLAAGSDLGPMVVLGVFRWSDATVAEPLTLRVSAPRLVCARTRFAGGTTLRVGWAEVALDGADFAAPSILLGESDPVALLVCFLERRAEPMGRPRLVSLRGANVANLALSNVDLRACRFLGAYNLDRLRIEGDCEFARGAPGWWYTSRDILAEERQWREQRRPGWYLLDSATPDWIADDEDLTDPDVVAPHRVAAIYRDLRKGREDRGDAPGAGDFYYGEMEMRRRAVPPREGRAPGRVTRDRGERAELWLYWLVSGYGMRASRALICLVVTIAVGAVLLDLFGFRPDRSFGRAMLFSLESTISLLRAPEAKLTAGGEVVQIALRLLGPLFFGLGLLALRGRVKR